MTEPEPEDVLAARALIHRWTKRNGHDAYVNPLEGGFQGYRAECWDCDWRGPDHLRGGEPLGTPESRAHKSAAYREAQAHAEETTPKDWRVPDA